MKKPYHSKWKIAASLVLAASLALADTATAALVVTTNTESGTANVYPFTPTWTPSPTSLIAGLTPATTANGNFNTEQNGGTARDVNSLTAGGSLAIAPMGAPATTTNNYVACGNNAGLSATCTLPAATFGYNITNITVISGWKDGGRDGQAYNISYSTAANPTVFNVLAIVKYNGPGVAANVPSAIRLTFTDSAGAAIATNVAQIKFDFSAPGSENGWTGYGALTVDGTPAGANVPQGLITPMENQNGAGPFLPTWLLESGSLITGLAPATATGNFNAETSGGTPILTDAMLGSSGDVSGFATAGPGAGGTLIYTLTNSVNGSDLTNLVVYSGWGNRDRDGQYYNLSYSTVGAPTTFLPITTVIYNPDLPGGVASANRVEVRNASGAAFAQNVHSLKFDFASVPGFDNNYVGLSEIIVQGTDSAPPTAPPSPYLTQDTLPAWATDVVGSQVIFTAAFSNTPAATLQWQVISGGVTNDVPGATAATLTLNNLQLADTGSYRLKAVNATNNLGVSYSSASPLLVTNVPAAVNNIITSYAAQTGLGGTSADTNFYPTWTVAGNSMIAEAIPAPGLGNFGLDQTWGDPAILTDGTFGFLNHWPGVGGSPSLVTCGVNPAGQSVTYTFDTSISGSVNGYDLTNIVVYGGWGDGGRDSQKYQILYSTVADPATFNQLVTVDYNPANPLGSQSATRATVRAATGSLVQNVAAVMFNFNLVGAPPENGYEGYSEIIVAGTPSAPKPVLSQDIRPLTAADVVGSQIVITAAFTSDTPVTYQWKKDGVDIPNATAPTLTLANLQLSDTATNGGYSLVASNASGIAVSRGCAVTVNPAPDPVTNLITAFAYQTGDSATFSPTWNVGTGSLIANQYPTSTGNGNFNDPDPNPTSNGLAGGIPVLTDENFGAVINGGPHPAFATCGPNAGQYVVYSLGGEVNGYTLTNIVIAGGWNDSGRDQQAYTVAYATAANPSSFIPLAVVNTNPVLAVNANKSVIRTTLTPATGVFASNVVAVMVNFRIPAGENGYSGYSEISLYGSPSTTPDSGPLVTAENQLGTVSWTVETPNLIAAQLPTSFGPGVFTLEGCNVTNLTDGVIGFGFAYGASCGADGLSVPYVIFNAIDGWDLTNIVVYSLWHDYGRDGQFYHVSYSTLTDPATFLPLASVFYNPDVPQDGTDSGNRVSIAPPAGNPTLATNVAAVKFDFTLQGSHDFGWSGYSEIVLQGTSLPPRVRFDGSYVSGGNLILTGVGTPGDSYTVLTATNVAAPIATWTTNVTGVIDGSGVISNAIPFSATEPARFFRLKTP